jgi:ketosteroid isomerase-like protein
VPDSDLQLVEDFYAAWNAGLPVGEFGARFLAEEVEWHDQPELPDARTHRGRDEVVRMLAELESTFGRTQCEIQKLETVGDEVLASFFLRGTGRASGVAVAPLIAHLLQVRGGRVARVRAFFTLEGAFFKAHAGGS